MRLPLRPASRLVLLVVALVASVALAPAARADLLLLRDGRRVVTVGAWSVAGDRVVYTTPLGLPGSLALADVDLEASRAASPATATAADAKASRPKAQQRPAREERIVLYATSWCPWCQRTRALFNELGVAFVERDVEADVAAAREKERIAPGVGVPVTVYGDQVVRGFSEPQLRKLAESYRDRAKALPPSPTPAARAD